MAALAWAIARQVRPAVAAATPSGGYPADRLTMRYRFRRGVLGRTRPGVPVNRPATLAFRRYGPFTRQSTWERVTGETTVRPRFDGTAVIISQPRTDSTGRQRCRCRSTTRRRTSPPTPP